MLETPHVAVGAAIAYKIPNPLISIPLALISHFVLDMTPHWNPHLNTELKTNGKPTRNSTSIVIVDVLLSLALGGFIAYNATPNYLHSISILAASFVSVLPDVVEGPFYFLNKKSDLIGKWIKFQKSIQNDISPLPGLIVQIITILAAVFWVLN